MMNCFKKIASIILAIVFVFSLASCESKSSKAIIYFEFENEPKNIDPQTASDDGELMLVRNLFEGLMRKDENGSIIEGACEKYSKSGLKYTFKLRENLLWSDKTPITADDFVFGLQRAVQKTTAAPFVNRLFCIKGAKEVYGNNADVSALSVKAAGDSVVITLEKDDPMFLETLSTSVAMPCNREYFYKTEGEYGQTAKTILCNGSYDIYKWSKEKFAIRLYKNENYKGAFEAENGGVFFTLKNEKSLVSSLADNDCDIAFIPSSEIKNAKENELNIASCENKCWVLTIGDEFDLRIKNALLTAFSSEIYKDGLGEGFKTAKSIYPGVLNETQADGAGFPSYDIASAKEQISEIIKDLPDNKFPPSTLYYYENDEIKSAANDLLGHWQNNLSAFINMQSSTSLSTLQNELNKKDLQFALFPITANNSSTDEYLAQFGLSGEPKKAQETLLSKHNILPFAFESTNMAYTSAITKIYMDNGNGYIDFAFVGKKV